MVDPDIELRGREGWVVDLVTPLAFLPSVISSFFYPNNIGGEGGEGPRTPGYIITLHAAVAAELE